MFNLRKELREITSVDIVNFCKEQYPEGSQLDYKKDTSTKGLAKHFVAFSNTRGGDIIIGVEENSDTGLPEKWEGVKNKDKVIESINQSVLNVDPLPTYEYHVTDTLENGNVFVVIRIFEGDVPPYYVHNDNNIYVRSHNVTKLIDLASPDYTKVLFEKKSKAEGIRKFNRKFVKNSFEKARSLAEKERIIGLEKGMEYSQDPIGSLASDLEVCLQPFYPQKNYVSMKEIKEIVRNSDTHRVFNNLQPYPRGLYKHDYILQTGEYQYIVLQGNGLFYWVEDVLRVDKEGNKHIWTGWILTRLVRGLEFLHSVYEKMGYVGVIDVEIALTIPDDVLIIDSSVAGSWFPRDPQKSFMNKYSWDFPLDTAILNDLEKRKVFIVDVMKQIEWDLGFDSTEKDNVLMKNIEEHR